MKDTKLKDTQRRKVSKMAKKKIISCTICEVQQHPKNPSRKIWRIIQHDNNELVGELTSCGLPQSSKFPVGTRHLTKISIPV